MKTRVYSSPLSFRSVSLQARAGFTLIELMISIVISLLILVALSAAYVNLARSNNELAKTNIQIENGRSAVQFLQGDLAHAGFWGSHVPQFDNLSYAGIPNDVPTSVPDPCLEYIVANWTTEYKNNLVGIPVQTYDALPATCASLISQQPNTDVLVVRHAEPCVAGEGNCEADATGKLYFQSTLCADEPTSTYVLDTSAFTLRKKDCATVADKRKFVSNIYYIRDHAVSAGDGIPTLVRSQFDLSGSGTLAHQTPIALIDGIEGFRIELGLDNLSDTGASANYTQEVVWANPEILTSPTNRGDGIPDGAFIRCTTAVPCTASQLVNVVAVKLFIVARTQDSTPGYTDPKTSYALGSTTWVPPNSNFKRHVFATSVRLNNPSSRRETP